MSQKNPMKMNQESKDILPKQTYILYNIHAKYFSALLTVGNRHQEINMLS